MLDKKRIDALIGAVNTKITGQSAVLFDAIREPVCDLIKKRQEYDKFHDDASFNLFKDLTKIELMGELYYSRILAKILNPDTPVIGDKKYLEIFVELLSTINNGIKPCEFSDNVSVEREKHNIDIAIYDRRKKYAIIIENKIKNALDQPNQLGKYYKDIKERGFEPLAIVYLAPNKDKRPNFKAYTGSYRGLVDVIQSIFVHLPAFSDSKPDLARGFLDKCVQIAENKENKIAGIFIEQFSKLIQYTGGLEAMSDIYRKRVLKEIYSNYSNFETAGEIAEMWKVEDLHREIIFEELQKELGHVKKSEFLDDPVLVIKTVGDIEFFVGYAERIYLKFGRKDGKKLLKEQQEKLMLLLKADIFDSYFDEIEPEDLACDIWRYFKYDEYRKSLQETVKFLADKIQKTEKEFEKLNL